MHEMCKFCVMKVNCGRVIAVRALQHICVCGNDVSHRDGDWTGSVERWRNVLVSLRLYLGVAGDGENSNWAHVCRVCVCVCAFVCEQRHKNCCRLCVCACVLVTCAKLTKTTDTHTHTYPRDKYAQRLQAIGRTATQNTKGET